jgi:23S rRNA (guanosine2251-2'-O)-methyltransferase
MKGSEDYIYGVRAVIEAVKAGKEIEKILLAKDASGELMQELFAALKGTGIQAQRVPMERINRVTRKNHQGVLAFISQVEYVNIETLIPTLYEEGKTPFILVLDGITDVRNFGAIARTAECAGVDAIVVPSKGSALINADAVKTSAGALNRIAVCRTHNLYNTMQFLKQSGLVLFGASEKGETIFTAPDMKMPLAVVLGAEDTGLSSGSIKLCDYLLSIPLLGEVASLNVSVAAGIVLYEAVKQRIG